MLPISVVEKLVACRGMRFGGPTHERRNHTRFPFRATAALRNLLDGKISPPIRAIVKDISLSGVGLVILKGTPLSEHWIVVIPSARGEVVLKCALARRSSAGSSHENVGASIVGMLSPGLVVSTGTAVSSLTWEFVDAKPVLN